MSQHREPPRPSALPSPADVWFYVLPAGIAVHLLVEVEKLVLRRFFNTRSARVQAVVALRSGGFRPSESARMALLLGLKMFVLALKIVPLLINRLLMPQRGAL